MDQQTYTVVTELIQAQLSALRVLSTLIAVAPEGEAQDRLQAFLVDSADHLEAALKVLNDG